MKNTETKDDANGDLEDALNIDLIRNYAKLSLESLSERLERYVKSFIISTEQLKRMANSFENEIDRGLKMFSDSRYIWQAEKCSFKMLDSCIEFLPTGAETGVYYALDFGGSNFRVVRAQLLGNNKIETTQLKKSLVDDCNLINYSKGLLNSKATASNLFDFFTLTCKELMTKNGDLAKSLSADNYFKACFTFSFPCSQRYLDSATLLEWTKGFETGRETSDMVEGQDVVQLMNEAFRRNEVPMEIIGVINDTVGTLLSFCFERDSKVHPPCLAGVILGTGFNGCYFEKDAPQYGYKGRIINLESGNFNIQLPATNVDNELDLDDQCNRGRQRLEKMVAGAYLGELSRRVIIKVLQTAAPEIAWVRHSLPSEAVSMIVADNSSNFDIAKKIFIELWNTEFDMNQLDAMKRLCTVIMNRAAALSAVLLAGISTKTKKIKPAAEGLSIAIDGSLYKCIPYFRLKVKHYLKEILGEEAASRIHLVLADDGSGKGAAILAAMYQAKMTSS